MALFRSIPHEVEAVQFKGLDDDMIPTFSEGFDTLPRWALKVAMRPKDHGLCFEGGDIRLTADMWMVEEGEWIVFGFGGGIRVMSDDAMSKQYTPARKRMYSAGEVGTAKAETAETSETAETAESMVEVAAPEIAAPKPEDLAWVEVTGEYEPTILTA